MCIRDRNDFERLRAVGRIVRATLDAMIAAVRPGITTAELNAIGARVMRRHGARSAPRPASASTTRSSTASPAVA
jgi:methionyl aminopeptidase